MPLTAFQQAVIERVEIGGLADLKDVPTVQQHPYVHPIEGAANQYLTVEWVGQLCIYVYDDEIGFGEFTLEREDFPTDESQIGAMLEEIDRLRGMGS